MRLRGGKVIGQTPPPSPVQPPQVHLSGGDMLRLLGTTAYDLYIDDANLRVPHDNLVPHALQQRVARLAEGWLDMPEKQRYAYLSRANRKRAEAEPFKRFLDMHYPTSFRDRRVMAQAICAWDKGTAPLVN